MADRPIEINEYKQVIELLMSGFTYKDPTGKDKIFRPNKQIALALQLQASIGLRIGDVLELKVSSFKNGKLQIREDKTNKLQYREVNTSVINAIMQYALETKLNNTDKLFSIGVRAVQKQLKIICDYLGLDNIATHSFRKLYAVTVYEQNNNNIELVKEMLNHTSIATTQRYIRVCQQEIDKASKEINFMI